MSSLPVWTDHIIISHKSLYQLYPAAEHLSPPSTTSRLSDSEVSEPDFEADSRGLNTKEKAKTRAWIRQEAASLSGTNCHLNLLQTLNLRSFQETAWEARALLLQETESGETFPPRVLRAERARVLATRRLRRTDRSPTAAP